MYHILLVHDCICAHIKYIYNILYIQVYRPYMQSCIDIYSYILHHFVGHITITIRSSSPFFVVVDVVILLCRIPAVLIRFVRIISILLESKISFLMPKGNIELLISHIG